MATARAHAARGASRFVPDEIKERYEPDTSCGGTDRPDGRGRNGDSAVQHIMATDDLTFDSSQLPMERTDHEARMVRLVTP